MDEYYKIINKLSQEIIDLQCIVEDKTKENNQLQEKLQCLESPYYVMKQKGNKKNFLYYIQNKKCEYCDKNINIEHMTYEHILPKSFGGTTAVHNVCLICKKCNRLRSNNMYDPDFIDIVLHRMSKIWWI